MSTDLLLFILRVVSAGLLLAIMGAIFYVIWREFRATTQTIQDTQRTFGQLVPLQIMDGAYIIMGEPHPLVPRTTIGRAPTNNIIVEDTFASNEHAFILLKDGQWWLEDQDSRNGTTLNEFPVEQPIIIADGDIIGVGRVRYRLELKD